MATNGKINTNPSGSSHGEQLVAKRLTLLNIVQTDVVTVYKCHFWPVQIWSTVISSRVGVVTAGSAASAVSSGQLDKLHFASSQLVASLIWFDLLTTMMLLPQDQLFLVASWPNFTLHPLNCQSELCKLHHNAALQCIRLKCTGDTVWLNANVAHSQILFPFAQHSDGQLFSAHFANHNSHVSLSLTDVEP